MKYCKNCGKQLPDDARFCVDCGTPIEEASSKRRVEQAGTIYKCPNCGEVLESMTAVCPACGYEIRNVKAVSSVQIFADKLTKIEAEEMPQVEAQRDVGVAGANALGQMGANGGGNADAGGFNPAAMMAGMTLGGAIGQNLAGTMNGVSSAPVPPPIPESKYYVAVNGQPTGPYTVASLREMMQNGQLTRLSLVWKDGMAGWSAVENVDDLKSVLGAVIPPIPTV